MKPTSPAGSFVRFLTGFLTLITMSFGLTYAVNAYSTAKNAEQSAAAAKAKMLQYGR